MFDFSLSVKYLVKIFLLVFLLFPLNGASDIQDFQRYLATRTVNFNLVLTC